MSCCKPKPNIDHYKFRPNYRIEPITEKCWSRHEINRSILNTNASHVLRYEEQIEKIRNYDARCHSKMPRYTNQTYGWLPGYKIRFLQRCDLNINQSSALQKVAKDLMQQHIKGPKPLTDHCACNNLCKKTI